MWHAEVRKRSQFSNCYRVPCLTTAGTVVVENMQEGANATWGKHEKGCMREHVTQSEDRARPHIGYHEGFWDLVDGDADPFSVMKAKGRSLDTEDLDKLRDMKSSARRERMAQEALDVQVHNERLLRDVRDKKKRKFETAVAQWSIYKIENTYNNGYDTYSDAMVIAPNETEAKLIHPNGNYYHPRGWWAKHTYDELLLQWENKACGASSMPLWFVGDSMWCNPICVKATWISSFDGDESRRGTVICSSFHAG